MQAVEFILESWSSRESAQVALKFGLLLLPIALGPAGTIAEGSSTVAGFPLRFLAARAVERTAFGRSTAAFAFVARDDDFLVAAFFLVVFFEDLAAVAFFAPAAFRVAFLRVAFFRAFFFFGFVRICFHSS